MKRITINPVFFQRKININDEKSGTEEKYDCHIIIIVIEGKRYGKIIVEQIIADRCTINVNNTATAYEIIRINGTEIIVNTHVFLVPSKKKFDFKSSLKLSSPQKFLSKALSTHAYVRE